MWQQEVAQLSARIENVGPRDVKADWIKRLCNTLTAHRDEARETAWPVITAAWTAGDVWAKVYAIPECRMPMLVLLINMCKGSRRASEMVLEPDARGACSPVMARMYKFDDEVLDSSYEEVFDLSYSLLGAWLSHSLVHIVFSSAQATSRLAYHFALDAAFDLIGGLSPSAHPAIATATAEHLTRLLGAMEAGESGTTARQIILRLTRLADGICQPEIHHLDDATRTALLRSHCAMLEWLHANVPIATPVGAAQSAPSDKEKRAMEWCETKSMLLSNLPALLDRCTPAKDLLAFERPEWLGVILSLTQYDDSNEHAREHAIFAIRVACMDHEGVQSRIASLTRVGIDERTKAAVLTGLGGGARVDVGADGRPQVSVRRGPSAQPRR